MLKSIIILIIFIIYCIIQLLSSGTSVPGSKAATIAYIININNNNYKYNCHDII